MTIPVHLPELLAVAAVVLAAASGLPAVLLGRRGADDTSTALLVLACAAGLAGAGLGLWSGARPPLSLPWSVPGGAFVVGVDALSAFFLVPIYLVPALGAIYSLSYWPASTHGARAGWLRLFYGLIVAGMGLLTISRNAVLFLSGWEVMALAAFFAITAEDRDPAVRSAGFVYLVATRLGTLMLVGAFGLLFAATGSFALPGPGALDASGPYATPVFLLALGGFGLKAGLVPLHAWLPGAHAASPSHVSAVMSGVLIKTGIYGIVRIGSMWAAPPAWWGGVVLVAGLVSGVLGVAFAIGQHDLKRLLAYHSVENIGIIAMGLGIALLGRSLGRLDLLALGLAGGLLHVWNHALFKSLLFLAGGAVVHAAGTREIDRLGGLLKKMPRTGAWFLLGAVAICGLPPLNGFVSELLVYLGLLRGVVAPQGDSWLLLALGVPGLALIGALAVACFVKVFGAVFLGEPRTEAARKAHEPPASMLVPMAVLAGLCALLGLLPWAVLPVLDRAVAAWAPEHAAARLPLATLAPMQTVGLAAAALVALLAAIAAFLRLRTRAAPAAEGVTWDCGYAAPSARMQYTSSSFAGLLVELFGFALRPIVHRPAIRELFPVHARFESHVPELVLDRVAAPLVKRLLKSFDRLDWVQAGRTHAYLAYVLAAACLLLAWQAWVAP